LINDVIINYILKIEVQSEYLYRNQDKMLEYLLMRGGVLIMNVGIIIHSYTGHTLSVAQRLREKLIEAGHSVNLERVTAVNEDPSAAGNIQLKMIPDISAYDGLIFAAPVRAFSLSPVMRVYLTQLPSLSDKRVGCFVTQQLPYPWMGGNRAIKQMKRICKTKGQNIFEAGIVNWSHKEREKKIMHVIEKLKGL
jgi:NAD(P)H dehydrogenase (quinone)